MKLKPATTQQAARLNGAVACLRLAQKELAAADCPRTMAKLRGVLKSAEGAVRHMQRRVEP